MLSKSLMLGYHSLVWPGRTWSVAHFMVEGNELVVRLSMLEKLGALRGDVRLPIAAVRAVRVSERPWSELRGVRLPGTGIPGAVSLCTRRGSGFVDFAAVYRGRRAVVVEAEGGHFDRLVVSCADASGEALSINEALTLGPF